MTFSVAPGAVATIIVTVFSPSALASASRSASAEPSLLAASLGAGAAGAPGSSSAAKAMGMGPAAESAAVRPTAIASRAVRLARDMGVEGVASGVISIPVRKVERVRNSVPDDRLASRK